MYICVCNHITETQIIEAVTEHNLNNLDDLRYNLGVGMGCGLCLTYYADILNLALDNGNDK
jgi:bacterioferritin-associated ferredoxin